MGLAAMWDACFEAVNSARAFSSRHRTVRDIVPFRISGITLMASHCSDLEVAKMTPQQAATVRRNGVSVCIPCFNSSARLPETLRHLQRQLVPPDVPWEVILVDNASTDDTSELARNVWGDSIPIQLRIVPEPRPGLIFARMRAIEQSSYEYVAFVDDDNWVCEKWVALVYELMYTHPTIGACGGCGEPIFEGNSIPAWFRDFADQFATGSQGSGPGYVPITRGYLYGAGLSIRRSAWIELQLNGFEFQLTGRKGSTLASGEDLELCYALQLAGWQLWYDPRLTFQHFISIPRMEWGYLIQMIRGFGRARPWWYLYADQLAFSTAHPGQLSVLYRIAIDLRKSWMFQVYAALRGLISARIRRTRRVADWFDTEVQVAYAEAHLETLLRHPIMYGAVRRQLETAPWRRGPSKPHGDRGSHRDVATSGEHTVPQ
jgi:glycosyltransferase involved in cell wall biosynthesis